MIYVEYHSATENKISDLFSHHISLYLINNQVFCWCVCLPPTLLYHIVILTYLSLLNILMIKGVQGC